MSCKNIKPSFHKCEFSKCFNFFSIQTGRQKLKRFCTIRCKERNCELFSEKRRSTARKNQRLRWHKNPEIRLKNNEARSRRYHALTDEQKYAVNKKRNDKYKDYRLQRHYDRMQNDIHYLLRQKISDRIRKAIKNAYGYKSKSCFQYIGCSIPEIRNYLESNFKEGMSWDNYGLWHIDHIKPCALFDLTDLNQQKICFHYTNLQPLWARDNLSKGAKYVV